VLCFVNSYSRPLAGGWLALLEGSLANRGVGLVGSCGSLESAYSAAPFWLKRRRRRDFPPFPNPHLRTNGFMLERELLLELDWPEPQTKTQAWGLESGRRSLARQVWDRGLDVCVVGRDGRGYSCRQWRDSHTFRLADQSNLLIADNRTQHYDRASARLRHRMSEMAWGPDRAQVTVTAGRGPHRPYE